MRNPIFIRRSKPNPGVRIRCIKRSHERLYNRLEQFPKFYEFRDVMYYEKNNMLSCETEDGKVLSTKSGELHSGKVEGLRDWIEGPDCSDGPDRTCQQLAYVTSMNEWKKHPYHDGVKIECIEDHGRRLGKKIKSFGGWGEIKRKGGQKYTLTCKYNGIVLSTSKNTLSRLIKWAKGPSCQPTINFSTTQSTNEVSTTVPSTACPRLQEIQAEIENEAKLKCIEDYGEVYKLSCSNDGEVWRGGAPIQTTKTDTIENLKKWAGSKYCGQGCECQEQFVALNKAKCVWPNKWQCQKTTVTGSCSGTVTQILQNVLPNLKKKRPETKKKHCEKLARRTGCDPFGYVPNCEN